MNQLFDANLLQAGKLEVLKGPATVVFGSNAQHGIINVLSRSVSDTPNQSKSRPARETTTDSRGAPPSRA